MHKGFQNFVTQCQHANTKGSIYANRPVYLPHGEPVAPRLQLLRQPHLLLEQLIITLSCRSTRYRTWTCTTTRRASGPSSTAHPLTSPLVGTADHNSILQEYAVQNLDLYYDTESQWPLVYSSSSNLTSCWNS
jgi:hypothetical protein